MSNELCPKSPFCVIVNNIYNARPLNYKCSTSKSKLQTELNLLVLTIT